MAALSGCLSGYASELGVEDFSDEEGAFRINNAFPINLCTWISGYRYKDLLSFVIYFETAHYRLPYLNTAVHVRL